MLRNLLSDGIFSSRAHVFHDISCCWRRNRSPAPAPLVFEFDVGDDGAVDALGVRSGGNVLGELQNSDSRVDASDFDTGICSRLTYNTYSHSYLLNCLSDAGSSSPHACSTSLSRAGMWEVTPNSLTFSSSWTKFLCFFFFTVSAIAGASRPVLSVFPRAFRAHGCGGERVTLLFGRARLCGPADVDTTMSVWLLERSDHSEKQRTLLLGLA